MPNYTCELCNYKTDRKHNLTLHKNSIKHKNNEINNITKNKKKPIEDPPEIQSKYEEIDSEINACLHCGQNFKHKTNLYRHQKYRCVIRVETQNIKKENEELKIQNKKLIDTNLNNSEVTKKTVNTLTYALKNFQNAPIVGLLEGKKLDGFIEYDGNTDKSIEEVIIHHFEYKKLDKFLGDLILKEYIKENPKEQSIWSTDVSRLTFILKQAVKNTNKGKWVTDKKGVDLTKLVITPLVEKVIEMLREYVDDCHVLIDEHRENDNNEIIVRHKLKQMERANIVIMNIKLTKMTCSILKYISPYFGLKLDEDSDSDDC
jgi:hypothetical protein